MCVQTQNAPAFNPAHLLGAKVAVCPVPAELLVLLLVEPGQLVVGVLHEVVERVQVRDALVGQHQQLVVRLKEVTLSTCRSILVIIVINVEYLTFSPILIRDIHQQLQYLAR